MVVMVMILCMQMLKTEVGTNNANFATPGDGGKPRMQMFLWDGAVHFWIFINH